MENASVLRQKGVVADMVEKSKVTVGRPTRIVFYIFQFSVNVASTSQTQHQQ